MRQSWPQQLMSHSPSPAAPPANVVHLKFHLPTLRNVELVCLLLFWLTALDLSLTRCVTVLIQCAEMLGTHFCSPILHSSCDDERQNRKKKIIFRCEPAWHKCVVWKVHSWLFFRAFLSFHQTFRLGGEKASPWKAPERKLRLTFDIKIKSSLMENHSASAFHFSHISIPFFQILSKFFNFTSKFFNFRHNESFRSCFVCGGLCWSRQCLEWCSES